MSAFAVGGALLGGVLVAVLIGYLIVRYPSLHSHFTSDAPGSGPQKFHVAPTPRIGGVPILLGLLAAALIVRAVAPAVSGAVTVLLACGFVAFAGGLAEDLTKRVSVRWRLLLTFVSAALGSVLLDARITQLDLLGFDWALHFALISFAFTIFAIGGFANAVNIVDGFNGLAGVISLIYLAAIAYIASLVGDHHLVLSSVSIAGAIIGFLLLNYPRGLIFLGDGGAYLVGFLIAELTVVLIHRNSEVSPWFALTMLSYPIVETMFSIYRKKVLRKQSPGEPDGLHFHMLVYKRLARRYARDWEQRASYWANAKTSPFLWLLALAGALPAVVFWNDTYLLQVAMAGFVGLYLWLYWRIVRFRTPRILTVWGSNVDEKSRLYDADRETAGV